MLVTESYMNIFCLALQRTPLVIEIINFTIESLAFQNRLLNGVHFISGTTLFGLYT